MPGDYSAAQVDAQIVAVEQRAGRMAEQRGQVPAAASPDTAAAVILY